MNDAYNKNGTLTGPLIFALPDLQLHCGPESQLARPNPAGRSLRQNAWLGLSVNRAENGEGFRKRALFLVKEFASETVSSGIPDLLPISPDSNASIFS